MFFVGIHRRKDIYLVILANIMTNPPVVTLYHLLTRYTGYNPMIITLVLEVPVVCIEAITYKKYGQLIRHPFLISFGANLFAYGTGYLLGSFL